MGKNKIHGGSLLKQCISGIIIFALMLGAMIFGIKTVGNTNDEESLRIAEESILRGVVSCYSIEGRYPESLEYLKENYGVVVDEDRYVVHYEIFASNIMPEITVTKAGE